MTVRSFGFVLFLLVSLATKGQHLISGDSLLELHIIGEKICLDKKGNLEFSYFFKNTSEEHLVIIDYYEPCLWENPSYLHPKDSALTLGLVLEILDSAGNVLHPARPEHDALGQDSLTHYEAYHAKNLREYEYHTRVLRPKTSLINFYSLRPSKRKCYRTGTFDFDRSKSYRLRLSYLTFPDANDLVNHSMIRKQDVVFVGKVVAKEVPLCFDVK